MLNRKSNHDRLVLITIITWHFQFHPVNVSILRLKYEFRARSKSRLLCYFNCYVTWCPLMMGIVASQYPSSRLHCACDTLPHSFNIDVFETVKNNSTTIEHIYNESVNFIDNCDVAFDTTDLWNQPKTVPVIVMEGMVTHPRLRYTRDHLPPGICSLIKPAAMAKLISFPTKTIAVMLSWYDVLHIKVYYPCPI